MVHVRVCAGHICPRSQLCDTCYLPTLIRLRRDAAVIGESWAMRLGASDVDIPLRAWTADPIMQELARQRVQDLTTDERMLPDLVAACLAGAARWWAECKLGLGRLPTVASSA